MTASQEKAVPDCIAELRWMIDAPKHLTNARHVFLLNHVYPAIIAHLQRLEKIDAKRVSRTVP